MHSHIQSKCHHRKKHDSKYVQNKNDMGKAKLQLIFQKTCIQNMNRRSKMIHFLLQKYQMYTVQDVEGRTLSPTLVQT